MTNYMKELCGLCFVLMLINLTTGAREQLVEILCISIICYKLEFQGLWTSCIMKFCCKFCNGKNRNFSTKNNTLYFE